MFQVHGGIFILVILLLFIWFYWERKYGSFNAYNIYSMQQPMCKPKRWNVYFFKTKCTN
jgi:hypothetical protein